MSNEIDVLTKAKLESIQKENEQLKNTVTILSGQVRARQQGANELFEANNNLRAATILLEDQLHQVKKTLEQLQKDKPLT